MKQTKKYKRRRMLAAAIGLLMLAGVTLAAAGLVHLLRNTSGPGTSSAAPSAGTTPSGASSGTTAPTTAPTTKPVTLVDGHYIQEEMPSWNLILVNQWNWLDQDYYEQTLEEQIRTFSSYGKMDQRVHQALQDMLDAAADYGLYGAYLFRTVERSNNNFNNRVNAYMNAGYSREEAEKKAQAIQARGLTSEHNIGLAADLECPGYTGLTENFENAPVFDWLQENCARFGFILRYPKDKVDITGVTYEPWHYRYVGVEAATEIMRRGICLEEYLMEKAQQ